MTRSDKVVAGIAAVVVLTFAAALAAVTVASIANILHFVTAHSTLAVILIIAIAVGITLLTIHRRLTDHSVAHRSTALPI